MTANVERALLVLLAIAAAGLYFGGAFDSGDVFTDDSTGTVEDPVDEISLSAPPAPALAAERYSDDLFPERGDWRGQPEVADLDGDGNLDLVASIRRWSSEMPADGLHVWFGDGQGGFELAVDGIRRDMGYGGSAVGDANGDGLLDVAFSGHDTPPQVFLNDGDRTWTESSSGLISEGVCVDVAFGDLDGDGNNDLSVMGMFPSVGGLYYFQGDGEGEWELREELLDTEVYGNSISTVDLDGDGELEILAMTSTGPRVWSHDGRGFVDRSQGICVRVPDESWVQNSDGLDPIDYIQGSDLDVVAYDFDGDGTKELFCAGMMYPGHDPLRVFRLDDDGIWQRWDEGLPTNEAAFDAVLAELDGEGHPEVVLAGRFGMKVFRYAGDGRFELVGRVAGTEGIINVGAGDFDADGIDEVVFIGFGGIRALRIQGL